MRNIGWVLATAAFLASKTTGAVSEYDARAEGSTPVPTSSPGWAELEAAPGDVLDHHLSSKAEAADLADSQPVSERQRAVDEDADVIGEPPTSDFGDAGGDTDVVGLAEGDQAINIPMQDQANHTLEPVDSNVSGVTVNESTSGKETIVEQAPVQSRKRVNCSSWSTSVSQPKQPDELSDLGASLAAEVVPAVQHADTGTDSASPVEVPASATEAHVTIVNNTLLASTFKSTAADVCTLLILYAPWCPFSARFAPHLNAASRAFPDLRFIAVNGATLNSLNSKFATVAVPNVILLQGPGKFVARFNYTEKNLQSLIWFIQNATNLTAPSGMEPTEADYVGPLPAQPVHEPDYYLHASWFVLAAAALYCISSTRLFASLARKVLVATRLQPQHQHVD